jgi:entericidin B
MGRLLVLLGLLLAVAGCNTISGIGQDVEAAGEAITGTAEDTKDEL